MVAPPGGALSQTVNTLIARIMLSSLSSTRPTCLVLRDRKRFPTKHYVSPAVDRLHNILTLALSFANHAAYSLQSPPPEPVPFPESVRCVRTVLECWLYHQGFGLCCVIKIFTLSFHGFGGVFVKRFTSAFTEIISASKRLEGFPRLAINIIFLPTAT